MSDRVNMRRGVAREVYLAAVRGDIPVRPERVIHEHEWERGAHMSHAFGVDGRRNACAICGVYRSAVSEALAG